MKKIFSVMDNIAKVLCGLCAFAFFAIIIYQVIARFFFNISANWTDEACRYLFVLMVYVAAVLAVNENGHFSIDVVEVLLPQKIRDVLKFVTHLISVVFLGFMSYSGWMLSSRTVVVSTMLEIPMKYLYLIFPVTGILMIIYTIRVAVGDFVRIRAEWKAEKQSGEEGSI